MEGNYLRHFFIHLTFCGGVVELGADGKHGATGGGRGTWHRRAKPLHEGAERGAAQDRADATRVWWGLCATRLQRKRESRAARWRLTGQRAAAVDAARIARVRSVVALLPQCLRSAFRRFSTRQLGVAGVQGCKPRDVAGVQGGKHPDRAAGCSSRVGSLLHQLSALKLLGGSLLHQLKLLGGSLLHL